MNHTQHYLSKNSWFNVGLPKTLSTNDKYSYSYAATNSAAPQDHSPIYATSYGKSYFQ